MFQVSADNRNSLTAGINPEYSHESSCDFVSSLRWVLTEPVSSRYQEIPALPRRFLGTQLRELHPSWFREAQMEQASVVSKAR